MRYSKDLGNLRKKKRDRPEYYPDWGDEYSYSEINEVAEAAFGNLSDQKNYWQPKFRNKVGRVGFEVAPDNLFHYKDRWEIDGIQKPGSRHSYTNDTLEYIRSF